MTRILVTGSRNWVNGRKVEDSLRKWSFDRDVTLVHGGARGVDTMADYIARRNGWKVEVYPADWEAYGSRAGMVRNAEMVKLGADICVAFILNDSPGASACLRMAMNAGIRVEIHKENTDGR